MSFKRVPRFEASVASDIVPTDRSEHQTIMFKAHLSADDLFVQVHCNQL